MLQLFPHLLLVWCKARSAAYRHELVDTARGGGNKLESQSTAAQATGGSDITGFTSSGFTLGNVSGEVNFRTSIIRNLVMAIGPMTREEVEENDVEILTREDALGIIERDCF